MVSCSRSTAGSWHGQKRRVPNAPCSRSGLAAAARRPHLDSSSGTRSCHADREGIAISTFGKVIKRGWDWLGVTPPPRGHVSGLIEAPDLAACLTLSKNDFIRTGARGATYLAYRKAMQEVVSRQLAAWGDARDADTRPRTVRLERDLERVLEDLTDNFPLLRSLVDRRAGGQKRLPMPGRGDERVPAPLFANMATGRLRRRGTGVAARQGRDSETTAGGVHAGAGAAAPLVGGGAALS